jgi:hypothetical protein
VVGAAGKGDAEQREPADRNDDAEPFAPGEAGSGRPRDEKCQDADAACGDGLDERQRCECDGDHIEREAGRLGAEPDDPSPAREQQSQRAKRCAGRERRQRRGGRVLGYVRPVDEAGGHEREAQGEQSLSEHSWKACAHGRRCTIGGTV